MKKLLPVLADIGHGILATLAAGYLFNVPLTWHFVIGVLCALLPDIDAVPRLLRTGSVIPNDDDSRDHRDYLHFPILFILIGIALVYWCGFWGSIFLIAVILHFLNDTWGTGDGIMWLWPVSKKKHKWHKIGDWKSDMYTKEINPTSTDTWIDTSYLQVTSISIIEYATFIIACVLLLLYFI